MYILFLVILIAFFSSFIVRTVYNTNNIYNLIIVRLPVNSRLLLKFLGSQKLHTGT